MKIPEQRAFLLNNLLFCARNYRKISIHFYIFEFFFFRTWFDIQRNSSVLEVLLTRKSAYAQNEHFSPVKTVHRFSEKSYFSRAYIPLESPEETPETQNDGIP